jgi:Chaperone of endosialidase
MSYENNVLTALSSQAAIGATSISVYEGAAPYNDAPTEGRLVLTDFVHGPTKIEIISYTGVTVNGDGTLTLTGVIRSQEGTPAYAWPAGTQAYVSITAADIVEMRDTLGGIAHSNYARTDILETFDAGLGVTGDIGVTGNVDGRDVAADGTKLDGVEAGATADQTGAQIKSLYEAEVDTNAFTDTEQTKLSGVATGATVDQDKAAIDALLINAAALGGVAIGSVLRSDAADIKTSGTLTFNDNVKIGFGTSNAEGTLYSDGTHTYWDMGADKDLFMRDVTTSRFKFDISAGHFHADGDGYFYSTSVGSDRNIKKDIRPIEDASAKLDKLTGVHYTLKKTGKPDAGLIAQDVQLVLPEAVFEVPELGEGEGATRLNLNYNAVIGLLVAGFQEEKGRVTKLEKRLAELKKLVK